MSTQSPSYPVYRIGNNEGGPDQRTSLEKLKGPQKQPTPRMNQVQLLNLDKSQ